MSRTADPIILGGLHQGELDGGIARSDR